MSGAKDKVAAGVWEIRTGARHAEVRAGEDGTITVAGYAAVFGETADIGGWFTEEIVRGAFKDAIPRDEVMFLINHEGLPLARTKSGTLRLSEDDHGLHMEAELDPTDPDVARIVPKMKRGDLDKMSFAFVPRKQVWDDTRDPPHRQITEAALRDVSIVSMPAYEGTEIGLRALQDHRRQEERGAAARRLRMKAKMHGLDRARDE